MGKLKLIEVSNMHKIIALATNKGRAPTQPFHDYILLKMRFMGTVIKRDVFMEKAELEVSFEEIVETL